MSGDSELETRKRRDFEDQQNELAGRETGRMVRFGVGAARAQEIKERERKDRAYRDTLARLLATDPEYQKLYETLGDRLGEAEVTADQTIEAIQTAVTAQRYANQDMRNRAPKIDGKAVFRYADGRVMDEDGNEIDPIIAAGIIWPDSAPTAEDYFAGVDRESGLRASLDDWQVYRNGTLGDVRNRHEDRDNPMSKEDMRDALKKIERAAPAMVTLSRQDAEAEGTAVAPVSATVIPTTLK